MQYLLVFPTCVGVFLSMLYAVTLEYRLPHVRGGVSATLIQKRKNNRSSPRAWGCFTTSTSSAALTAGLPHVRGGVSNSPGQLKPPYPSSPRAWGCFCVEGKMRRFYTVFPTCVGVFLGYGVLQSPVRCLPHVRGGVSIFFDESGQGCWSSTRAWGCFR